MYVEENSQPLVDNILQSGRKTEFPYMLICDTVYVGQNFLYSFLTSPGKTQDWCRTGTGKCTGNYAQDYL